MAVREAQSAYKIVQGSTHGLPDVQMFLTTLGALDINPTLAARTLFDKDAELVITRAPGRLDVMGGIADYSGSLVLQLPIAEAALVALQQRADDELHVWSPSRDDSRSAH